jgi:hypothetical protein
MTGRSANDQAVSALGVGDGAVVAGAPWMDSVGGRGVVRVSKGPASHATPRSCAAPGEDRPATNSFGLAFRLRTVDVTQKGVGRCH